MNNQPRSTARAMIRSADRIFICYSHSDLRRARDIRSRLVRLRTDKPEDTVFFDQLSLLPGEDVSPAVIDRKLAESSLMVVLCGEDTPRRVEVQRELELAASLREQGTLSILPVILKPGVKLPARVDYKIQAIQLTTLFPEILWTRIAAFAGLAIAITVASFFAKRSFEDRARSMRLSYGAMVQRLTEQVDQELAPGNPNRSAERALLVAREAYNLLDRADAGHSGEVELALRKALAVFPPMETIYQEPAMYELRDLAVSSDGRWIATAYLGHVQLFDSGRLRGDIMLDSRVVAVRFSADGKTIAAVTVNGQFCVWEVAASGDKPPCQSLGEGREGETIEPVAGPSGWAVAAKLDSKGELQIRSSRGLNKTVSLDDAPSALAVGKDGTLYVAGWNANVYVYSEKQRRGRPLVLRSDRRVDQLTISPDGKYLAGRTLDQEIIFWRLYGADPEKGVSLPAGASAMAFDPLGRFLVTGKEGSIEFHGLDYAFDLMASRAVPCAENVQQIALSRDGSLLVIGCGDAVLQWKLPRETAELRDAPGKRVVDLPASILQFHPTNPDLLAAGHDGVVDIIDVRQRKSQHFEKQPCGLGLASQFVTLGTNYLNREIVALHWNSDDALAVVQRNGETWWVDLRTHQAACNSIFLGGHACQWTVSRDGKWNAGIVESAGIPLLSVWEAGKLSSQSALDSGSGPMLCSGAMAFHPKLPKLYGGAGSVLKSWERSATDGKWMPSNLRKMEGVLSSIALDRDGTWLVAGGGTGQRNGFVWFWRLQDNPAQGQFFPFPEAEVRTVRFGLNGSVAVSFSDGTVRVWNIARLSEPPVSYGGAAGLMDDWNSAARSQVAQNISRAIGSVLFTPKEVDAIAARPSLNYAAPAYNATGKLLAVAVGNRIQILDAEITNLAAQACTILPRNLTWQDWLRFAPVGEPYELTCSQRPVHASVLAEGDRQVQEGHDREAIVIYRRAAALGQQISPEVRLHAWHQRAIVLSNIQPDKNKLALALEAYGKFKDAGGEKNAGPIPFADTLHLCRWSALLGEPRAALPVCNAAVDMLAADEFAHDSRGLARALTGDLTGARADFEQSAGALESWRATRLGWVEAMKNGQNPITSDVVKQIVAEELAK